ncbi:MAG: hypothetical protein JWQ38_1650 [Flavipsychrobacter sp.]|nr:hypothetical protein [Flavipsychrobacter sp.]
MHGKYINCFLFFAFTCFFPFAGKAQEVKPWSGFGIEADVMVGRVFKQEVKFKLPIPPVSTAIDINLVQHTCGRKAWHKGRNYPTLGLGFCYINYGIDSVYGRNFSLYPNISIPLIEGKKIRWTISLGDGPAYVTNFYRRTAPVNTVNVAVGSHFNNFVKLSSQLQYQMNRHWDLRLGANLEHMSNSSYRKPNLGINMPGGHIGVCYYPVTSKPECVLRNPVQLKNRWLAQVRLSMATVANYTSGGPSYPVYIATGYMSRRWQNQNKLFAGLDHAYYENIYAYQRNNEINPGNERRHSFKSTVFAGNEFLFGRLGLVVQVGAYLQQSVLLTPAIYEKLGGHYYLVQKEHGPIKELFLSAMVKTHLNVAELGEVGFGFGF